MLIAALMIALRPQAKGEERVEEAPLVEVIAFEAASGPIPVRTSGTVQALDEVAVGVQVSGRLIYVNPAFRQGGSIGKGATLVRIEQDEYVNRVRMAEADFAAQNVAVLQAQQEVAIAKDELERFARREAQLSSERDAAGQSEILPPAQLSSRASPDARPTPTRDPAGLATRQPQLGSAQASQQRASASLSDAQIALSRTRVTAPFGGLVRQADAAVGTLVQPGQVLGSIVSTAAYEVRVTLSPDEAAIIPGLFDGSAGRIPATVFSDYGGQTFSWPAYVVRAGALVDANTRNIEVFLRVPSPLRAGALVSDKDGDKALANAPPLLVGSFVRAQITGSSIESYAIVPASAVRPGNEVWLVRDGKLAVVKVRVIQRRDDVAYVTTPSLGEGGRLIVSNLRTPVDGMAVRVRDTEAK